MSLDPGCAAALNHSLQATLEALAFRQKSQFMCMSHLRPMSAALGFAKKLHVFETMPLSTRRRSASPRLMWSMPA